MPTPALRAKVKERAEKSKQKKADEVYVKNLVEKTTSLEKYRK